MPTRHRLSRIRHNTVTTISYFIVRKIVSPIIRIIWIKKVIGIENIPQWGPAIIAFNHQSYFDFLCFVAISPRNIHFLSAEKFFSNRLWRPIMRITGQIKVERQNRDKYETHKSVYEHLDAGKIIGIFPEGTRSPDEHKMLKAFTGVAKYAVYKNVPVIPVGIKGTFSVMSRHDKKPKFSKVVEFHIGKPIDGHKFLVGKLDEDEYERITHRIMLDIASLSGKEYPYSNNE
jgi:1-acyl-sn-glycerol-3-phosphate acyltransferase